MRSGTLPCGLRYAVRRSGHNAAWCALSIACGTRSEDGFPEGTAHFVEHTLFRGTARRSAASINSCLDRLGGELNAYTTKEEIVLHATVLKRDLGKAARLLFELATEPSFPEKEIQTERGVVLDEIISYKDNPAEDVYDRFESLLFASHPLGRPILGTTASVKKITPAQLKAFVSSRFTPERMAFTVVADLDEALVERRISALAARLFPGEAEAAEIAPPEPWDCASVFDKVLDKHHHEVNAVIGGTAPSLYEMPERLEAAMLVNILGGPASNSLLNRELREKHGWVYSIECNYTPYADTGVVAISFGCDRPQLERCLKAVDRILSGLRDAPLSQRRLDAFRKQLLGQLAISSDAGEAQCLSMGKNLMVWGEVMEEGRLKALLEAITPERLQQMARRIFAPEKLSRLVYL